MASVKVVQLRKTLEVFAGLYDKAGAKAEAQAIREISQALRAADKRTVDDLAAILSTGGQHPATQSRLPRSN